MLEELKAEQKKIAGKIKLDDLISEGEIEFVAGVDQSFVKREIISACVVLKYPSLVKVAEYTTVEKVEFPYIPTFLMFREGMPAVRAVRGAVLNIEDKSGVVVFVDGSGIAHPRKCGLACFVGVETGYPTLGITKKRLYGDVEMPESVMGSSPIMDGDVRIGYALKTCKRCNPIFISPGSNISVERTLDLTLNCLKGYKLPEPVRMAHELATKRRKDFLSDGGRKDIEEQR